MSINLKLFFILLIIKCITSKEELKFVFEIFRHGARAPYVDFKESGKDCYNHSWIEKEELSEVGKRMHYLLGVRNRHRYIDTGFLSKKMNQSEVIFKSTDVNRTLQSIYAQLQGLYEVENGIKLNISQMGNFEFPGQNETYYQNNLSQSYSLPHLLQLAPVHILNNKEGRFNLQSGSVCPTVSPEQEKQHTRKEVKEFQQRFINEFGETLRKLAKEETTDFLNDYWETYRYTDAFIADEVDGDDFQIIKDIDKNFDFDKFREYAIEFLSLDYFGTNYFSTKIVRMACTYIMLDILDYMDNIIKGNTKIKLVAYSAHDSNMAGIELFNELISGKKALYSPFASNSFYELFLEDEKYKVRYTFNEEEKYIMEYKDFKKAVLKNILSDEEIKEYCGFVIVDEKKYKGFLKHLTFIFCALDTILLAVFVFIIIKKNKSPKSVLDELAKNEGLDGIIT